jgi:hypothetical protein
VSGEAIASLSENPYPVQAGVYHIVPDFTVLKFLGK